MVRTLPRRAPLRSLAGWAAAAVVVGLAACGGQPNDDAASLTSRGAIRIWLSTNAEEATWGTRMVTAWNAAHPDQPVSVQQIPAGKSSEEVISAAIIAGNAPCLVYNTAPAAVPQFTRQGGLVALDGFPGAREYLTARTGQRAAQYASADGQYYQLPWKANPVMVFYNKDAFARVGLDPLRPPLATYDQVLSAARSLVRGGAVRYAIWPAPTSEFYQAWFDFYPLFIAQSDGQRLVEDGHAQFDSADGRAVAGFWRALYADRLAPQEKYAADSFADGTVGMVIAGPWAVAVYENKVSWGVVPVPTRDGRPAERVKTFSDAKNIALFSACRNRATAWDVLKFSTSVEQDGALLELTGQMPMRTDLPGTYPRYFADHPAYRAFAAQADRTVEVPQVVNSIEIWQEFRNAYSRSVIFGKEPVAEAFAAAARTVDDLARKR